MWDWSSLNYIIRVNFELEIPNLKKITLIIYIVQLVKYTYSTVLFVYNYF